MVAGLDTSARFHVAKISRLIALGEAKELNRVVKVILQHTAGTPLRFLRSSGILMGMVSTGAAAGNGVHWTYWQVSDRLKN